MVKLVYDSRCGDARIYQLARLFAVFQKANSASRDWCISMLLTVLSFFSLGGGGEGKGGGTRQTAMKSMRLLQSAPITMIAQMTKSSPDAIIERLKAKGITVANADQTVAEIAKSNQRKPQDLLSRL